VTPQRKDETGKWKRAPKAQQAHRWRARCYYRGQDGVLRQFSRFGRTKDEAARKIDKAFESAVPAAIEMTDSMRFVAAGRMWLDHIAMPAAGLSERTISDYTKTFRRHIDCEGSLLRGLSLAEANNPQRLRTFLQSVADTRGTSAAHVTRSVLTGIMRLAIDNGVVNTNALRQIGNVKARAIKPTRRKSGVPRDTRRAFTRVERDAVVERAYQIASASAVDPRTARKAQATADLIAFLAGTGVRISEARSLRWDDVDLASGRVEVRGTKSRTSHRNVTLPHHLLIRIRDRSKAVGTDGLVFASPAHVGTLTAGQIEWDQSNCAKEIAKVLQAAGHAWATPHSFRRTVATIANAAGAPLVDIADQLGHADPSMTARVYLGRDPFGSRPSISNYL
jgi:integrase